MRLLLVFLAACSLAPTEAELLVLEELTPTHVDAEGTLAVRGRGFPAGREGRLRLLGRFHRPGQAPSAVDVEVPARAVAAERAEATLDEATILRLGGRGTLQGEAILSFDAAHSGQVSGRLPIELDVGAVGVDALRVRARRETTAPEQLGVELTDDPLQGARVVGVVPESPAARAGVREGDRVVAVGGVRVRSGADLLPNPTERTLLVERPDVSGELMLRLPRAQSNARSGIWLVLLLPLVGWWILGPGARELRRVTPRGARPRASRGIWMALVAGACAALLGWRSIDVSVWLAASLALRSASLVASKRKLRGLGLELGLWMVVAGVCVATGSTTTGAAWAAPEESVLARAPLMWGLVFVGVLSVAGPRGKIADAHRALVATFVVGLASGGLDHGAGLAAIAAAVAIVSAWLPTTASRWALASGLIVLPLHVAATVAIPAPTIEEALALAIAAVGLPAIALGWPRRRVPRLHAYL